MPVPAGLNSAVFSVYTGRIYTFYGVSYSRNRLFPVPRPSWASASSRFNSWRLHFLLLKRQKPPQRLCSRWFAHFFAFWVCGAHAVLSGERSRELAGKEPKSDGNGPVLRPLKPHFDRFWGWTATCFSSSTRLFLRLKRNWLHQLRLRGCIWNPLGSNRFLCSTLTFPGRQPEFCQFQPLIRRLRGHLTLWRLGIRPFRRD